MKMLVSIKDIHVFLGFDRKPVKIYLLDSSRENDGKLKKTLGEIVEMIV